MIGILGALDEEVDLIREALTDRTAVEKAGNLFHCGKLGEIEVTVIRCGIGKVNAAICTQILIDRFQCEKIIFGWVAGAVEEFDAFLSKSSETLCRLILGTLRRL